MASPPEPVDELPAPFESVKSVKSNWWEDPYLNLSPGQRYTLVIVVIVIVLLLKFGLPVEPSSLRGVVDSGRSVPSAASATTSAPDPGSQASTSPVGLQTSSPFSSALPSASAGSLNPLADGAIDVPEAFGSNPVAAFGAVSGPSGSPTPTTTPTTTPTPSSSPTCPVSLPTTGTPVDSLSAELTALCGELLAKISGTVPVGSLPAGASSFASGGGESSAPGAATTAVPAEWSFVDSPIGTSGESDPKWPSSLSVEMTGKSPTVTVGLVQSSSVPTALVSTLGGLVHDGALVQVLLVPQLNAAGGPESFGSWVAQVLATLKPVALVEIGTGGAPTGSNASTVAAYTAAGLAAARGVSANIATGILWLDGGASSDDGAVWSTLASTAAWSSSSFMARTLDASAACSSQSGFATMERHNPAAAALPVVTEVVPGSAPASGYAADSSCVKSSLAQDPAASLALWRLWQGPDS